MKESGNISLGSRRSYKNSKWWSTDGFVGIVGIGIRSKPPMMPPFTNSKVPNHGINMSWALETLKWPGKVVLRLYWNPILNNKNIWLTLFLIFVPNNIKNPWTFLKGATFITANSTLHVTPWVTKSRTSHFRRCNLVSIEQLSGFILWYPFQNICMFTHSLLLYFLCSFHRPWFQVETFEFAAYPCKRHSCCDMRSLPPSSETNANKKGKSSTYLVE